MEKLLSAAETGSVDKVKEVIENEAISPTACSEVSFVTCMQQHNYTNVYMLVPYIFFAYIFYDAQLFQL